MDANAEPSAGRAETPLGSTAASGRVRPPGLPTHLASRLTPWIAAVRAGDAAAALDAAEPLLAYLHDEAQARRPTEHQRRQAILAAIEAAGLATDPPPDGTVWHVLARLLTTTPLDGRGGPASHRRVILSAWGLLARCAPVPEPGRVAEYLNRAGANPVTTLSHAARAAEAQGWWQHARDLWWPLAAAVEDHLPAVERRWNGQECTDAVVAPGDRSVDYAQCVVPIATCRAAVLGSLRAAGALGWPELFEGWLEQRRNAMAAAGWHDWLQALDAVAKQEHARARRVANSKKRLRDAQLLARVGIHETELRPKVVLIAGPFRQSGPGARYVMATLGKRVGVRAAGIPRQQYEFLSAVASAQNDRLRTLALADAEIAVLTDASKRYPDLTPEVAADRAHADAHTRTTQSPALAQVTKDLRGRIAELSDVRVRFDATRGGFDIVGWPRVRVRSTELNVAPSSSSAPSQP